METSEKLVIVALVIVGLYFLVFHRDPLPLNHESVGLGTFHIAHDVIGVALIGVAGFLWLRSRRPTRTTAPT